MASYLRVFCFSLFLLSTQVIAECSLYMGKATLNEVGKVGFIEIILLDDSILESSYTTWKVKACKVQGNKNKCTSELSLPQSDTLPYIVVPTTFIPSNAVFDVILTDGSGKTIDYLSVGYSVQRDNDCTLTNDSDVLVSNSHDYRRKPDGSGSWGNAGNGNSGGNSEGSSNAGASLPYLTVADASGFQGDTIEFTVTLSSAVDVTFNYTTLENTASDNKALAGVHYTTTSGTGTISNGDLTTTISVNTVDVGDNTTRDFNLFIDAPINAEIRDYFAKGEIKPVVVDHFEINTQDAIGLTCEADQIIIKACADAACVATSPDAVDVVLSVSDSIGGVLTKNVTVTGGEINVGYIHTKAEVVSLSLDETYKCKGSNSIPCNVDFRDAGFVFSAIDDQVAGLDFSGINIQAVKDVNGVCTDLLSGNKSIDMAMEYIAPNRATTNNYSLSGTAIAKNISGNVNTYTPISLSFVANSIADLGTNKYDDAGQVKLYARYVEPASGGNASFSIEGSSSAFWVSPHHFSVIATNGSVTLDGNTNSSTKKQVSGDDFTLSFIAENAANNPTTNYIAQQAQLQLERTGPTTGGIEGILKYSNNQSISSKLNSSLAYVNATEVVFDLNGEYNFNAATYSEVGLTKLYIQDNSYGTGSYKAQGVADIGRFIPDHFTVKSIADGILMGACNVTDLANLTDLPFIYSGQMLSDNITIGALSYLTTPSIVIEAQNKNDELTQNYIGDFFKLSLTSFNRLTLPSSTVLAPDSDSARMGKDNVNLVRLVANLNAATLADSSGEVTYSYGINDSFVYLHEANSEINEFTANIDLSMVSIVDSDTVAAQDYDGDALNSLILTLNPAGKLIRFGRAQLENSYGPDTSDLPQTLSVNYYTDNGYVLSETDTCTTYDSANITLTNISLDPAKTPVKNHVTGALVDGETRTIILTAPTTDPTDINTGQVEVIYNISDWLKYDWAYDDEAVDGLFNDNPRAVATFGIYRGNDRIIYQREIYR